MTSTASAGTGTGFVVEPGHLRGFAGQMERQSDAMAEVGQYVWNTCGNTDGWSGLILSQLREPYQAGVSAQGRGLTQWSNALEGTGRGLRAAADRYERSDAAAAARYGGAGGSGGGSASYPDAADPTDGLTAPASYDSTVASQVDEIGGTIGIINDVYEWVTGESLLQKIVEPITGDWGKLYSLADAWENVGGAMDDFTANVRAGQATLSAHWHGDQAATAFAAHVNGYLPLFADEKRVVTDLAGDLRDLAEDVKESFDVIIQTLNTVASIISAALSSVAIPVYGQAKLVKAVWDTAKLIWNIYKIINAIRQMVSLIIEVIELLNEVSDRTGELPAVPR